MDRWQSEQQFHDQQAAQRARALTPADYVFTDDSYLHHESWIAPALASLGDVRGKCVLDLGCGHGMAAVVLARHGAHVTACDLSQGYVREASRRAEANGVPVRFVVCNAERLPFADGAFERIWGNAILHHLDMRSAAVELERVLAPGGVAVFCEPWGGNRWLELARRWLPYPGKGRTADERPLDPRALDVLRKHFPRLRVHGFQLLSMVQRICRNERVVHCLARWDARLLQRWSYWQRYCRYIVVMISK